MFQRVEARQAGASAIGILVPQGTRTLVIVRPRALSFDLLPARWTGDEQPPQFCTFSRDEAALVARRLIAALEAAVAAHANPVQTFGDPSRACFQIWLRTDEYVWIACRRAPGQAYAPVVFADQAEATREAERLSAFVWPALEAAQEYYVNTQVFLEK
jgi:hypothetical protein